MAFLLVVIVEGVVQDTEDMYFRDIDRCNYFSYKIGTGDSDEDKHRYYTYQRNITSYCLPKMVEETTKFWD
jgi:hypothetical protein|tara:strand:- start:554 stop:766 length:213 start_codon:yes stop_codon:yes gene_type:complete